MRSSDSTGLGHLRAYCGLTILAVAGVLLMPVPASAVDSGPTRQPAQICMQKLYGAPVSSANKLNCSANDIRLSRAINTSQQSCVRGTTFNLTATFETIVTANARYDAGFFFRTDGGSNARGDGTDAMGQCSLSGLTIPPPPNPPALNLDGDTSGDLNSGTYQLTFTIPNVQCTDTNGDGFLNLPNCTSWHSNQGTFSSIEDPFTFNPDTKSKCVCDDTFEVPVRVEEARLGVTKTPSSPSISEPGGEVTYTVTIENTAQMESVEIRTIVDDRFGDKGTGQSSDDNTCPSLIGTTLAPRQTATCTFKDDVWGQAGYRHTNTVTVGAYQASTTKTIAGEGSALVTIDDAWNDPTLEKNALSTANCQLDATYQVVVTNNSEFDRLTVNSLGDDKFGDVTTVHGDVVSTDCAVPQTIETNKNYTCHFVGRVKSSTCDISHTNTVTADVSDDDRRATKPSDDAIVVLDTTP